MSDGLDKILASLNKNFGKPIISSKASDFSYPSVERIPTGSLSLDLELGGGIPRGRITMVVANESAGKTFFALKAIAAAQKQGLRCAFIDVEGTFDPVWAALLGVDVDKLTLAVPDVGEQACDIIEALVRSGEFGLIVLDSVAAMMPAAELNVPMYGDVTKAGEYEASPEQIGNKAQMLNRAMRRFTSAINQISEDGERNKTAVVLINQFREKVGVMYGNPETIPGGKGIKFASSVILELRKSSNYILEDPSNKESAKIGQEVKFKTQKNKTFAPMRTGTVYFYFAGPKKGQIDRSREIFVYARLLGLVEETAKGWYKIGERKLQGEGQATKYLDENPEIAAKLEADIRARYLKENK